MAKYAGTHSFIHPSSHSSPKRDCTHKHFLGALGEPNIKSPFSPQFTVLLGRSVYKPPEFSGRREGGALGPQEDSGFWLGWSGNIHQRKWPWSQNSEEKRWTCASWEGLKKLVHNKGVLG